MKPLTILTLSLLIIALCENCRDTGSSSKKTDETFVQPTDVQGVSCSYAVYNESGGLKSCVLAREDTLSGQPLPEGTIVFFTDKGVMERCFLPKDTEIQGHRCKGDKDNWETGFYPNGNLKLAWLACEETIQGVPCAASTGKSFFSHGAGTYFHEDGSLASCELASNTTIEGRSLEKGDRVSFDQTGRLKAKK